MNSTNNRPVGINKQTALFIKGVIIGKVLTILVGGGLLWLWLKPRLTLESKTSYSSRGSDTISTAAASTFKTVNDVPIGSFKYGGSTAWAPIRQLVDSQIQNARPELQLNYVDPPNGNPGSSSGIRMLLDGQLDFAQSSGPLTAQEYARARQQGFILEQHQVGLDGIAVVVNPSLQVPGLTIDQLQQIYRGQITNWNQVGGPDLPITLFAQRPEDADTLIFAENSVLNQQVLSSSIHYVYSTTQALRLVSQNPGGVYYASARAVVPQCSVKSLPLGRTPNHLISPYRDPLVSPQQCPHQRNQLNIEAIKTGSYPISSSLFVITKRNKGQQQQAGEAYTRLLLTDQGQKAIEQAGFIPVR